MVTVVDLVISFYYEDISLEMLLFAFLLSLCLPVCIIFFILCLDFSYLN